MQDGGRGSDNPERRPPNPDAHSPVRKEISLPAASPQTPSASTPQEELGRPTDDALRRVRKADKQTRKGQKLSGRIDQLLGRAESAGAVVDEALSQPIPTPKKESKNDKQKRIETELDALGTSAGDEIEAELNELKKKIRGQ